MQTYQDRIDQNLQAQNCPFCSPKAEIIIDKNEHFHVLLARAPYTPDHLLIVPIRHLIYMHELSSDELASAMLLSINEWMSCIKPILTSIFFSETEKSTATSEKAWITYTFTSFHPSPSEDKFPRWDIAATFPILNMLNLSKISNINS